MAETLKDKLSVKEKWIRLIFMIIFACLVYWIAFSIVIVIAAFQFFYILFVGKSNRAIAPFGASLSEYINQIMQYLTYCSEEKPFPFKPWPGTVVKAESRPVKATAKKIATKKATARRKTKAKETTKV